MSKIISAEIKKQVSKPGIFILALLLAIILVLGVFVYKPTETTSDTAKTKADITASSVTETYSKFYGNGSDSGMYIDYVDDLQNHLNAISSYRLGEDTYKTKVTALVSAFNTSVNEYHDSRVITDKTILNAKKAEIVANLDAIYSTVYSALQNKTSYAIITTESNYDELEEIIGKIKTNFNREFSISDTDLEAKVESEYQNFKTNQSAKLNNCLSKLTYPTITDAFIDDYTVDQPGSKYETTHARLSDLMRQINELKATAQAAPDANKADENIAEMQNLICNYVNTTITYNKLIEYELLVNAISSVNAAEQLKLYGLKDYTLYDLKTNLIKFNYLFENDKTDDDFANPLTIGVTSHNQVNAFDYAYFSLNLFAIVIIAYAVMSGCGTIAGEIKDGTMRYLAIRPVGRRRMFLGKFLSIMIMSAIFIIFSSIVAYLVGGFIYSFDTLDVLTIFNGTTAIVMPQVALFGIYLISLFVEVAIYVSIAMLVATLVKSDLLSVTIVLLLYLINLVLPIFTGGINSWLAFYPFSHISLYSLFGSSIYADPTNFFYLLLGAKVYSTSNIILTSVVVLLILIGVNILSSNLFKKKEL